MDNQKKTPVFSLGTPASSGTSASGIFGTSNTSTTPSLFGSKSTGGPFSSSSPFSLGGNSSGGTGFSFGQQNTGSGSTPSGGFSFTADKSTTPSTGGPSAFSGFGATSGQTAFGKAQGKSNAPLFGTTTPATDKTVGSFAFNASTTPAGPPPMSSVGVGGFGLGQSQQTGQNGLFGSNASEALKTQAPAGKPTEGAKTQTSTNSLFGQIGGTSNAPSSSIFGQKTTQSQMFQSSTATTTPSTASKPTFTPSFGNVGSATTPGSTSMFKLGSTASETPASTSTSKPATTAATPSFFSPASTSAGSQAPKATSTFNFSTPAASKSGANATTTPTANVAPTANTPASTAAPATTVAATPSLFGSTVKPSTSAVTSSTTTATTAAAKSAMTTTAPITGTLASSTVGPAPSNVSRLKNKSMDEIITRWASDLQKYKKMFQEQSQHIAGWDRMLVENSDRVQKLYGGTLEAERATAEVERQLNSVENQQEELSSWLDRYERDVDAMIKNQVGQSESLQGPDQERERTYKLAERIAERLDEMGKDLTSMIEEINIATVAKTKTTEDSITQIVRVLNSHLSQLQIIDQGTAALQAKVSAAQKSTRGLRSNSNLGNSVNDASDDFYRSFMGRG